MLALLRASVASALAAVRDLWRVRRVLSDGLAEDNVQDGALRQARLVQHHQRGAPVP